MHEGTNPVALRRIELHIRSCVFSFWCLLLFLEMISKNMKGTVWGVCTVRW